MIGEEENIGPQAYVAGKYCAAEDPVIAAGNHDGIEDSARLAGDIDDLRRRMLETFLCETSFTADPVIMISRQLDTKIVEYMKYSQTASKKAR